MIFYTTVTGVSFVNGLLLQFEIVINCFSLPLIVLKYQ